MISHCHVCTQERYRVVPLRKFENKYIVPTPPSIYQPYQPEPSEEPLGLDLTNPTIQLLR